MRKSVFLKCRFGDHLPSPHKAVELSKEDADYLILEGLATESLEPVVSNSDARVEELEGEITELKARNVELEGEITELKARNVELEGQLALLSPAPVVPPKTGGK